MNTSSRIMEKAPFSFCENRGLWYNHRRRVNRCVRFSRSGRVWGSRPMLGRFVVRYLFVCSSFSTRPNSARNTRSKITTIVSPV